MAKFPKNDGTTLPGLPGAGVDFTLHGGSRLRGRAAGIRENFKYIYIYKHVSASSLVSRTFRGTSKIRQ